jgi:outer membrane receptor protein involved in Fe transport
MSYSRAAALAVSLPLAAASAGASQPPSPAVQRDDAIVYPAGFFAQFSPRSALDMIQRTPGFALEEGSARRGFAGAEGNVLIDGERPVAKSQSLSDILQRIPAAQVLRIELLRGGQAAGDRSGHAVLANVVRTASAGEGAWQLGIEYAGRAPVPNGWASWSGRLGRTDYSLGANGYSLMRHQPGDRLLRDGSGAVTGTREDASPRSFHEIAVNGEVSRPVAAGRTRLTGQVYRSRYHQDESIETFSPAGFLTEKEINPYTETKRTLEAGLGHERSLGRWGLSMDLLLTRSRFESEVSSTRLGRDGQLDLFVTQDLVRDSGETIVRGRLERDLAPGHRLEASIEAALNSLDQRLARMLDRGGGPFPLPVPNGNLGVREHRADAALRHNWTVSPRWSIETMLAAEVSELSFHGDSEQSVGLGYFKPSLQVTRKLEGSSQLRLKLYRDVDQLDFTDFVSAASVSDDIIEGGNPDLKPETSWRIEATADLRFATDAALSVTLFRYWLSDAVDLIPVEVDGIRFDAPGNIGDGDVRGVTTNLQLPLRPLLPGGSFTLDATWRRSRVTDPVTGKRRTASDFEKTTIKAEFRQDLPARKFAWGSTFAGEPELTAYRFDEIDRRRDRPQLDLWAETTALPGLKVRLTLASLLTIPNRRTRTFFVPDRNGAVSRSERSEHRQGRWLMLSASGTF